MWVICCITLTTVLSRTYVRDDPAWCAASLLTLSITAVHLSSLDFVLNLINLPVCPSNIMVATQDRLWNSLTSPWPFPDQPIIFPEGIIKILVHILKKKDFFSGKNNKNNVRCTHKGSLSLVKFLINCSSVIQANISKCDYCIVITGYWSSTNIVLRKTPIFPDQAHFSLTFFKVSTFPE